MPRPAPAQPGPEGHRGQEHRQHRGHGMHAAAHQQRRQAGPDHLEGHGHEAGHRHRRQRGPRSRGLGGLAHRVGCRGRRRPTGQHQGPQPYQGGAPGGAELSTPQPQGREQQQGAHQHAHHSPCGVHGVQQAHVAPVRDPRGDGRQGGARQEARRQQQQRGQPGQPGGTGAGQHTQGRREQQREGHGPAGQAQLERAVARRGPPPGPPARPPAAAAQPGHVHGEGQGGGHPRAAGGQGQPTHPDHLAAQGRGAGEGQACRQQAQPMGGSGHHGAGVSARPTTSAAARSTAARRPRR